MDIQEALRWFVWDTSFGYTLGRQFSGAFQDTANETVWETQYFTQGEPLPAGWEPFSFDPDSCVLLCKRRK